MLAMSAHGAGMARRTGTPPSPSPTHRSRSRACSMSSPGRAIPQRCRCSVRAGGDAPIEAEIRIANVTSAVNGGVQVVGADATLEDPATWLEVATGTVTIDRTVLSNGR